MSSKFEVINRGDRAPITEETKEVFGVNLDHGSLVTVREALAKGSFAAKFNLTRHFPMIEKSVLFEVSFGDGVYARAYLYYTDDCGFCRFSGKGFVSVVASGKCFDFNFSSAIHAGMCINSAYRMAAEFAAKVEA
jgi:hypothetical protein